MLCCCCGVFFLSFLVVFVCLFVVVVCCVFCGDFLWGFVLGEGDFCLFVGFRFVFAAVGLHVFR